MVFSRSRTTVRALIVLLLLAGQFAFASRNELQEAKVQELLSEASGRYASITTLQTQFTQVRKTRMLKEPATTKGCFFYRKPDLLLWEFKTPYKLKIFYTDNAVIKVDAKRGTYSKLNVRKYRESLLNFLNISKTIDFLDKYFVIKEIDTKLKDIYIIFIPKKHKVRKRVKLVEVWLDPDTKLFRRIKLAETNGSETEITFHHTVLNEPIPDKAFLMDLKGLKKEKWQE